MNKDHHVLLGPEVVKAMLKALDTLALEGEYKPPNEFYAEWHELGGICLAMTNDEYPIPQVTHLSQNEVDMFNDEIHVKAQAEARFYLAQKRKEMLRREAIALFSVIGISFSLVFIFAIAQ